MGSKPEIAGARSGRNLNVDARLAEFCSRRSFDDADEQAAYIAATYPQRYEQLESGRFAGEMTTVEIDGVQIIRERINRTLTQAGTSRQFSLLWAWNGDSQYRCDGIGLGPRCVKLYRPGGEFQVVSDPSEMVAISVSREALMDWNGSASDLESSGFFSGFRMLPPDLAVAMRVALTNALSFADARHNFVAWSAWRSDIRDEIVRCVSTVAELPRREECPASRRERSHVRIVQNAREYMCHHSEGSLTVFDLCRRIGVSKRNLHYAFSSLLGVSPGHYLRTVRLNAVRRAIKRCEDPMSGVADIASRWGFYHPSHFAGGYKRLFGELPSDTARRSGLSKYKPPQAAG